MIEKKAINRLIARKDLKVCIFALMNLLVVAGWFPSPLFPDHGDFVLHQCSLSVREGLPVRVLSADLDWRYWKKPGAYSPRIYHEVIAGVPVTRITGFFWPKWNEWSLNQWILQWEKGLVLDMEQFGKPELLHAHTWWGGVVAYHFQKKYGIPYVLTEHSTELFDKGLPSWKREAMARAYSHARKNLAVGEDLKKAMDAIAPEASTRVFPNFLDDQLFFPGRLPEAEVCHVGFSGNLIPRKRPDLLVDAFIRATQRIGPNRIMLHIAGAGPMQPLLEASVKKAGLAHRVRFYGKLEHEQMPDFYRMLSVFVLPSSRENFSLAVAEALACGIPVISSKHNAWEGFLHKGNGILLEALDTEALTDALLWMAQHWMDFDAAAISAEALAIAGATTRVALLAEVYKHALGYP